MTNVGGAFFFLFFSFVSVRGGSIFFLDLCEDLGRKIGDSFPAYAYLFFFFFFFFFCGNQPAQSKLRQLWPNVSWRVACELLSLIGSHTMLGQHVNSLRLC